MVNPAPVRQLADGHGVKAGKYKSIVKNNDFYIYNFDHDGKSKGACRDFGTKEMGERREFLADAVSVLCARRSKRRGRGCAFYPDA